MAVSTFQQTDSATQPLTAWAADLDGNVMVLTRLGDMFAPHQQATPNMTAALDPGHVFNGTALTEVAAQTTGTITAPVSNPRIDRLVINQFSGTISVVTGTEASSPTPPTIPTGSLPVAQILLQTSTTTITNNMITDERDFSLLGGGITNVTAGTGLTGGGASGSVTISLSVPVSVAYGGTGATSAGPTAANNIGALASANNLSDLSDAPTARTNLGLGSAATKNASGSGPTVASISGAVAVGHLAIFADTAGTLQDGGIPLIALSGTYINSSGNVSPGLYYVDTTSGPITLTVSSTLAGGYTFVDAGNYWGVNNLTINGNGNSIGNIPSNLAGTFLANVSDYQFSMVAEATYWRLV